MRLLQSRARLVLNYLNFDCFMRKLTRHYFFETPLYYEITQISYIYLKTENHWNSNTDMIRVFRQELTRLGKWTICSGYCPDCYVSISFIRFGMTLYFFNLSQTFPAFPFVFYAWPYLIRFMFLSYWAFSIRQYQRYLFVLYANKKSSQINIISPFRWTKTKRRRKISICQVRL